MKWLRFATLSVFIVAFGDDDLDRDMSVTQGGVRETWLGPGLGLGLGLGLGFRDRVRVGV